jgi:two-component system, OmpR family, response regulator
MRILLVEDDKQLSAQLHRALQEEGFVADDAFDGEEAQFLGETEPYDAVVLDLGLPKCDGISVLKRWREKGRTVPVLILTARDDWSEKVAGFRAGADDYVTKPFRIEEVVVRLRALIRRSTGHAGAVLRCGPVEFDTQLASFTLDGLSLRLTPFESQLLAYLMHNAERPISRSELSEHLYDRNADRDFNSIEVIIARLRRKIGTPLIKTIRGQGYMLTGRDGGD